MKAIIYGVVWLAVLGIVGGSSAQTAGDGSSPGYPTKPIRVIVPYAAGGVMDSMARIITQKLYEVFGGRFYVENLNGAGGTIGTGTAANAPADGYTIVMVNPDFVVQPIVKTKVPYDPMRDFAPVTLVANAPEMIAVNPSVPAQNFQELIALLKANPGKYTFATPGVGTTPHLAGEWIYKITYGLDVVHVPFQRFPDLITSAITGQTPIVHGAMPAWAPYVKDGKLRGIVIEGDKRSAALPDVPTLAEVGLPGYDIGFWIGFVVPSGTSTNIVDLLSDQISKVIALPDVKERLATLGYDTVGGTPNQFAAKLKAESEWWSKVVREVHIRID